jgi:large subunit ribosomal protein L15
MPLQRRLPKKGFNNPLKPAWQVVNVGDLERKDLPDKVTPSALKDAGLIRRLRDPVKILGDGELTKAFEVEAHAFSKSAADKIVAAGGKVGRT